MKSFGNLLLVSLGCLSTPLVLFLSTSISIYIGNQAELEYNLSVLSPFLGLSAALFCVGVLLYNFRRYPVIRFMLTSYYLVGPAFLIYVNAREILPAVFDSVFAFAVISAGPFLLSFVLNRVPVAKLTQLFAVIACVLFVSNLGNLLLSSDTTSHASPLTPARVSSAGTSQLPNIYHIVFDEYQTDMFELTLSSEVRKALGGFSYYPNNTTVFGRTGMTLSSVFTGTMYNYVEPQTDYMYAAYNTERSILYWLKNKRYTINGYLFHRKNTGALNRSHFDWTIYHKDNVNLAARPDYMQVFMSLWFYAFFPKGLSQRFLPAHYFQQLESQTFLPNEAPVISYLSFRRFLKHEAQMPGRGRYTFMHLVLPHFPNVMRADCSYGNGEKLRLTSAIEQSRCATRMIMNFVETLKRLGRFKESVIVIQADHGSRYRLENGKLRGVEHLGTYSVEWSYARARALLLVKPAGVSDDGALKISKLNSMLIDVGPTILDSIGIQTDLAFDGTSLLGANFPERKFRYYHFFKKHGGGEITFELKRYIIEKGEIRPDRVIPLKCKRIYALPDKGVCER